MWLTKRIHDTWKVVKGMSSFNFDLIFDSGLLLYRNRPRDHHRSGTLEMFLVSLLYDRICLRIDVFNKLLPEYSVYNPVSLCVLLDNICFVEH